MPDFKFTIQIPYAEKSHEFIFAFLRTSQWGEWKADAEKKSDAFVLNFCRGSTHFWNGGFFGIGARWVPQMAFSTDWSLEKVPLLLRVSIRPSPSTLAIGLHYHSLEPYGRYGTKKEKEEGEAAVGRVQEYVFEEVRGLSDYLRDVYGLSEPPGIAKA